MIWNVGLVAPEPFTDELVRLSRAAGEAGSVFTLGPRALPHLTLVQFEATSDEAHALWRNVPSGGQHELTMAGLSFVSDDTDCWIELPALHTSALRALHEAVVDRVEAVGHDIVSGTRDRYRPHVTVGLLRPPIVAPLPLESQVTRATVPGWTAALLAGGPYYTVTDIVATT